MSDEDLEPPKGLNLYLEQLEYEKMTPEEKKVYDNHREEEWEANKSRLEATCKAEAEFWKGKLESAEKLGEYYKPDYDAGDL